MIYFFLSLERMAIGKKCLSSTPADVFSLIGVLAELGILGGMLIG